MPTFGSIKGLSPLIEIKKPPQPLIDGIIFFLLSVVGSAGDDNGE